MILVDVDGVDGSSGGWLDMDDVVDMAGVVAEVVAEVFVVGKSSSTYLTLELRFLRASFGLDLDVVFAVGFYFSLTLISSVSAMFFPLWLFQKCRRF